MTASDFIVWDDKNIVLITLWTTMLTTLPHPGLVRSHHKINSFSISLGCDMKISCSEVDRHPSKGFRKAAKNVGSVASAAVRFKYLSLGCEFNGNICWRRIKTNIKLCLNVCRGGFGGADSSIKTGLLSVTTACWCCFTFIKKGDNSDHPLG